MTSRQESFLQFQVEQRDEYIRSLEKQLFESKQTCAELQARTAAVDASPDNTSHETDTPVQHSVKVVGMEPEAVADLIDTFNEQFMHQIEDKEYRWDALSDFSGPLIRLCRGIEELSQARNDQDADTQFVTASQHKNEKEQHL